MTEPRPTCFTCLRPQSGCVCSLIQPVDNRTAVTILQHPGERSHAFNSVRLATLGLTHSSVHITWPDDSGRMRQRPNLPAATALLYPRDDATDLEEILAEARPEHLVVLDGTWSQARRLYRDNPWLHDLQHVRLAPASPSQYRIREEPAPHCLSTIESIAEALHILEPDTEGLDTLLDGFLAMVNTQAEVPHAPESRYQATRRRTRLDRLVDHWDRVLVCHGESVGLRGHQPTLLQWTACRVATGEVFECQLHAPDVHPSQRLKRRLDPSLAESRDQFTARWAAFAGDAPLIATWGVQLSAQLRTLTGRKHDALSLREMYGNLNGGLGGTLAQILEREQVTPTRRPLDGRAGEQLAKAVAMAELLLAKKRKMPR